MRTLSPRPKIFLAAFVGVVSVALLFWGVAESPLLASGAKLYFGPAAGNFAAGKTFTTNVLLDSGGGVGVNAAEGTVSFNPSYLSVVSVSKEGSVFSLWTSEPAYSNSKGTVTFSGGNPSAYSKAGGTVIKIVFKALQAGSAELGLVSASALAADGKGTNVLSETGKASYTIGGTATPAPAPKSAPETAEVPTDTGGAATGFRATVDITSPSHPDPEKWYANKNPQFKWKLPPDLDGVSAIINKSASSNPPRTSEGAIDVKEFTNLEDGVWFLHIRFKNQAGSWSQTIHRKVLVDTSMPESFSATVHAEDKNSPPKVALAAEDKTSGIDRFDLKIDDKIAMSVTPDQLMDGIFVMQPVLPGSHKLEAKAIDKAGNTATSMEALLIPGVSIPEIRNAPGIIEEGDPVIVEGVADGNSTVTIRIEQSNKAITEETVKADEDGRWVYVYKKHLSPGEFNILSKMLTKAGAESEFTEKLGLTITKAAFLVKYGLVVIMFLIFVIIGLILYGFYGRREAMRKADVIKRETDEMRDKTEAIFAALNEEVEEKIKLLDPIQAEKMGVRPLDANEILEKFKEALDMSHDTLAKEVEDIEKALE